MTGRDPGRIPVNGGGIVRNRNERTGHPLRARANRFERLRRRDVGGKDSEKKGDKT